MINYKGFVIKSSNYSNCFRVFGSNGFHLYPNTFDTVADARKFIDIIIGDFENDKK